MFLFFEYQIVVQAIFMEIDCLEAGRADQVFELLAAEGMVVAAAGLLGAVPVKNDVAEIHLVAS